MWRQCQFFDLKYSSVNDEETVPTLSVFFLGVLLCWYIQWVYTVCTYMYCSITVQFNPQMHQRRTSTSKQRLPHPLFSPYCPVAWCQVSSCSAKPAQYQRCHWLSQQLSPTPVTASLVTRDAGTTRMWSKKYGWWLECFARGASWFWALIRRRAGFRLKFRFLCGVNSIYSVAGFIPTEHNYGLSFTDLDTYWFIII